MSRVTNPETSQLHMLSSSTSVADAQSVADALLTWAYGIDSGDERLIASVITEDFLLDASQYRDANVDLADQQGRETVAARLSKLHDVADTMHYVSNIRSTINKDCLNATASCYIWAQHFRKGEGPRLDVQQCFTMGHIYHCKLRREENVWQIAMLTLQPVWLQGDGENLGIMSLK